MPIMADLQKQVEDALDKIRPMLQADGGDVEFVELDGNVVKVRLTGACSGCPMAKVTLKRGVEARIKQDVPEVEAVEAV